ncbi:MAG: hypothetical protein U0136_02730 [Bdellovibrionota bacterium]
MLELVHPERAASETRHLMVALALSFLCHLLFFTVRFSFDARPEESPPIEIQLISPPPPPQKQVAKALEKAVEKQPDPKPAPTPQQVKIPEPQKQYVDPAANRDEPTVPTRLLSEHSSRADVQKLRRGDSLAPPEPVIQKSAEQLKAKTSAVQKDQPEKTQLAKLEREHRPESSHSRSRTSPAPSLRLSDRDVLSSVLLPEQAKVQPQDSATDEKNTDTKRAESFAQREPFQRSLSATLKLGSSDHLPEIPDGDITLLNAKADRFAVFVRRVALQVFGALRRTGWQELHYSEVRRINGFATVEAVMSRTGKLLSVTVTDSSGSTAFDGTLSRAASEGTWDQNPPSEAAASDQKIHFVFKARTWGRPGQGGVSEQRWLLLGTGLL